MPPVNKEDGAAVVVDRSTVEPFDRRVIQQASIRTVISSSRRGGRPKKISFFGHFGRNNFGNESTLQAILYNLRELVPDAQFSCICTGPVQAAETYKVASIPIESVVIKPWPIRNQMVRLLRKIFVGIPSEMYRWLKAFHALRNTDLLIIPGTGLLTDAYGIFNWGPYSVFKWCLLAKVRRCKVAFLSVGAGPLHSKAGRILVKLSLSLADFRSYRDGSTLQFLKSIGFRAVGDQIFPDLAFSLPQLTYKARTDKRRPRPVVGLGLMEYPGRYSNIDNKKAYEQYLETLSSFVKYLLSKNYDVRLLIGDVCDESVKREFKSLLMDQSLWSEEHIIDEPVRSVEDLMLQIAATDIVVATRFHNVLFTLLQKIPVISVSFHHKCASLMKQFGLSRYCLDMDKLDAERLIKAFSDIEAETGTLPSLMDERTEQFRKALNDQYHQVLGALLFSY